MMLKHLLHTLLPLHFSLFAQHTSLVDDDHPKRTQGILEPLFDMQRTSEMQIAPLTQGRLDTNILAEFYLLIMKETHKEFSRQADSRTYRDTRQYGFDFFKMLQGDFSYISPPQFLQELGAHVCKALGHPPIEFTNIILSVYDPGFHLEPHIDVDIYSPHGTPPFYFSERVYGIIIEPDPTGHLYFVKWDQEGVVPSQDLQPIYSLQEQAGTIFCLEGPLRHTPYFHAVSPVSRHRISITFRTVERIF